MGQECSGALDTASSILLAVLYSTSGVFAVVGNSAVLWVIYRVPRLRTPSNWLLASLAVADLVVGLIVDPLWVARSVLKQRPQSDPFKITIDFFWLQTTAITTFTLCAVTLDRYIAVTYVFRYGGWVTLTRCQIVAGVVWGFSLVFASARFFTTNPNSLPRLWTISMIATFILPFVLIVFCYAKILGEAREQRRKICHGTGASSTEVVKENIRGRKSDITVGIIVGLFVVLWLPSLVTSLVHALTPNECTKVEMRRVWLWVELLAFISSSVNPWVYCLRNGDFRQAFRGIFGRVGERGCSAVTIFTRSNSKPP